MKLNLELQQNIFSRLVNESKVAPFSENQAGVAINYQAAVTANDFHVELNGIHYSGKYFIDKANEQIHISCGGYYYRFNLIAEAALNAAMARQGNIISTLPGKILKVLVKAGDQLEKGQPIIVEEAMKMQHTLSAERSCEVEEVLVKEGEQITADQLLVKFT